jgi:uncharacterized protein (TIGR03067 family)
MNRTAGLLAVAIALLGVAVVRADAAADDWKKLAGTWKVDAATLNGEDATGAFKEAVLTIEEGKYKVVFAGMSDTGTLKLDPSRTPKLMSITGTDGPSKGKTLPAVYEIDGDTLKVCYTLDGQDPPTEFKSTADNKTLLVKYKRDKK